MSELLVDRRNVAVAVYISAYAHEQKAGYRWAVKCVLKAPEMWIGI